VFETHRRHCGGDGVDDARRVETAAHPHFQYRHIDVRAPEIPETHRGERLEGGEWVALDGTVDEIRPDFVDELDDGGFGDLPTVDADAFPDVVEVRRGVEARTVARLAEDGLGHACGAAFPVRAGYLDELDVFVRVAEMGQ